MTFWWIVIIIFGLANGIVILLAGALASKRHRAERKYWRDYDQENGT